jgi:hypothetical protein
MIKDLIVKNEVVVVVPRKELEVLMAFRGSNVIGKGTYRVITQCRAGFMVSSDVECDRPIQAFRAYKARAIASIAWINPMTGTPVMVFARRGKKIWASESLLVDIEVGDINQDLTNTGLYSQAQYKAVNSKTWADKAYVMNK